MRASQAGATPLPPWSPAQARTAPCMVVLSTLIGLDDARLIEIDDRRRGFDTAFRAMRSIVASEHCHRTTPVSPSGDPRPHVLVLHRRTAGTPRHSTRSGSATLPGMARRANTAVVMRAVNTIFAAFEAAYHDRTCPARAHMVRHLADIALHQAFYAATTPPQNAAPPLHTIAHVMKP